MDKKKKEIRRLLVGDFYLDEEDRLVPTANVLRTLTHGYHRGADNLRFFGIKEQHQSFAVRGSTEAAERAMLTLGMRCILPENPKTFAVMRRGVLLLPVVMTLDAEGEGMTLGLYTARSPLCGVNLRRIQKKWLEAIPAECRPIPVSVGSAAGKKET